MLNQATQRVVSRLKKSWWGRALQEWRHERFFTSSAGYAAHRGVYANFSEAKRNAPADVKLGFDHPEAAQGYLDRLERIFAYDYPVLYWMRPIIPEIKRVFDMGGNIGVHYYSYQRYLDFPPGLQWQVCEVSEVVKAGQAYAQAQQATGLQFTTDPTQADGAQLLIACGSLQYVESPRLEDLLAGLRQKPRHLIINKISLYGGAEFVTLQNVGTAYVPQYVFNRQNFVDAIGKLGYQLVDSWLVPERYFVLPGDAERSFGPSSGLYFRQP